MDRRHLSLAREIDPLMGWTSSRDMKQQLQLSFDSKDEAVAYAERNGIPFRLSEPKPRRPVRKSYADGHPGRSSDRRIGRR